MKKDPVCLMDLDEQEAISKGLNSEWHGRMHVFCSEQCKQDFEANPERYATEAGESVLDDETDYTY